MSRRRRHPPITVTLVLPAELPTQDEIDAVLMATDSIIGDAGRSGVVLILNDSRSQKALGWEWDKLPDYGRLRHLTADQIGRKVGWSILRDIKFMVLDEIAGQNMLRMGPCCAPGSPMRYEPCARPSTARCRRCTNARSPTLAGKATTHDPSKLLPPPHPRAVAAD
jgi:hypothetical protein